jgi:hypothetical protein
MCEKCLETVARLFPDEPEERWADILLNYTRFPFGTVAEIREQLEHVKEVGFEQVEQEWDFFNVEL